MKILFSHVNTAYYPDANEYIRKMLEKFKLSSGLLDKNVTAKYILENDMSLPVADETTVKEIEKSLSPDLQEKVRKNIQCGLRTLKKDYPLLAGEELEKTDYSYLLSSGFGMDKNTPLLKRVTNFATVFFFFEEYRWENTSLLATPLPPTGNETDKGVVNEFPSVLKKLLTALVSELPGGKYGAILLDGLLSQNEPYFDQLSRYIIQQVSIQLQEAEISKIQGKLEGVTNYIKNEYLLAKKSEYIGKKELILLLQQQLSKLEDVKGILQKDYYRLPGFSVYMVAVSIHICILRELASVDKTNEEYKRIIMKLATSGKEIANETYRMCEEARMRQIEASQWEHCAEGYHTVVCNYYFKWKDNLTGEEKTFTNGTGKEPRDGKTERDNSMNEHKGFVRNEFHRNSEIDTFINSMNTIIQKPVINK